MLPSVLRNSLVLICRIRPYAGNIGTCQGHSLVDSPPRLIRPDIQRCYRRPIHEGCIAAGAYMKTGLVYMLMAPLLKIYNQSKSPDQFDNAMLENLKRVISDR